ncbi:MAG: hypothetical protein K8U03_17565 [Planctomycetia bacterium]|nr:hypothetical protein [Planctomycetia bacterium]
MKTIFFAVVFVAVCVYALEVRPEKLFASKRVPLAPPAIPTGERFYVVLLAHQNQENEIAMSHTFAVFLRTSGTGAEHQVLETRTINWLPVSGHVSIVRPAEPGINKSLAETLAWAKQRGLELTMRGPYEIDAEFFGRAAAQVARLERGDFKYRCFNTQSRNTAKNCIHAVADIFEDQGRIDTGSARGHEAMLKVAEYFQPRFKGKELLAADAEPLLAKLNLQDLRKQAGEQNLGAVAAGE